MGSCHRMKTSNDERCIYELQCTLGYAISARNNYDMFLCLFVLVNEILLYHYSSTVCGAFNNCFHLFLFIPRHFTLDSLSSNEDYAVEIRIGLIKNQRKNFMIVAPFLFFLRNFAIK